MKELSLHILDLVQNAITAHARKIKLIIDENTVDDILSISIEDDGCGMNEEKLSVVIDPFYTTRTTRNVGLGIPMFKMNAEQCGGEFSIDSVVGKGTTLKGTFKYSHIDRAPLGDMPNTIVGIVLSLDTCNLHYCHIVDTQSFELNTEDMRIMLGEEISLSEVSVLQWVKEYVDEGLALLKENKQ